ncbi:MAG: hypothetical protein KBT47_02285, partial [Armatimonadetes bacterium]|nr:hypothetical protein [Candidatus Hippobium faecium]
MIFLFLILIIAVLSVPSFSDVNIPLGSSRWTDRKDYKNALCIDNFNKSGNVFQGDPKTSLYLKYDSENVYAMFGCTENEKGYPLSFERSSVSDLMQDDAVMLVFGVSGENSVLEKMNMGGYEGAYSEMAQADYYYQ